MGRPKNPNRPPAIKNMRFTERAYHKVLSHHIGQEPYSHTVERIIDELETLRKKVQVLELDIEGLDTELRTKDLANTNLINILKRRDREIDELKAQRRRLNDDAIQEGK